jgi:serine/threonine protein kinase, bacterial
MLSWAFLSLSMAIALSACNRTAPQAPGPPAAGLSITAIHPTSGPVQSIDTITGSDFNALSADDSVYFDGTAAAVVQASATQLIVTVPVHSRTGRVTVKVGDSVATGPIFTVLALPIISSISPTHGLAGIADTIKGAGFEEATPQVSFNGVAATVVSADSNKLIVYVPISTTGPVSVTIGGLTSQGPVFTYDTAGAADSVMVSTLAGSGVAGSQDGTGTAASFSFLWDVAADQNGNVFVADPNNHAIRKITPSGIVTTIPGTSDPGNIYGPPKPNFYTPEGVAVDQYDTLFISDVSTTYIFTDFDGVSAFLAGNGTKSVNGDSEVATFTQPRGMAVDKNDNLYVVDLITSAIKKITPDGWVSILAGGYGVKGGTDGTGAAAGFLQPTGVAVDDDGNVFVADYGDGEIRKITPNGVVTTLAGNLSGATSIDGVGSAASFAGPIGLALDAHGNIYVADYFSSKIRKVTPAGVVTTIAGTGVTGGADGPGRTATFNEPTGIAVDGSGNIYVSDGSNYKVRKIVIK